MPKFFDYFVSGSGLPSTRKANRNFNTSRGRPVSAHERISSGGYGLHAIPDDARALKTPAGQLVQNLIELQAISRYLLANSPLIIQARNVIATGIIGTRLPAVSFNGIPEAQNKKLQRLFNRWATPMRTSAIEACDYAGQYSLYNMLDLMITHYMTDGLGMIAFHRDPAGLKLEGIDSPRIPTYSYSARQRDGNTIYTGRVLDKRGVPIGWVINDRSTQSGTGLNSYRYAISETAEIYLDRDVAVFQNLRNFDQLHGIPPIISCAPALSSLIQFTDAAVKQAEAAARNYGFIKRAEVPDAESEGVFDPDDDKKTGSVEVNSVSDDHDLQLFEMANSDSIHSMPHEFPNAAFGVFIKSIGQTIASGLGIAYHNISGDLSGMNFSSSRMAEMSQAQNMKRHRVIFEQKVLRPIVYEFLLWQSIHNPRESGISNQMNLERAQDDITFKYTQREAIEPARQATADATDIATGVKSRAQVITERGADPKDVLRQRMEEAEAEKKINPPPPPPPSDDKKKDAPDDDPDSSDDEDNKKIDED